MTIGALCSSTRAGTHPPHRVASRRSFNRRDDDKGVKHRSRRPSRSTIRRAPRRLRPRLTLLGLPFPSHLGAFPSSAIAPPDRIVRVTRLKNSSSCAFPDLIRYVLLFPGCPPSTVTRRNASVEPAADRIHPGTLPSTLHVHFTRLHFTIYSA